MITIPTSTTPTILGIVTSLFGDSGMILLITLVCAIPLFFYIVDYIISLFEKEDPVEKRAREIMAETDRLLDDLS